MAAVMEESGDAHKKNKKKFHTTKIQTTTYLYVYIRVLYGKKGMPFFRTNLSTTYFFPLTLEFLEVPSNFTGLPH